MHPRSSSSLGGPRFRAATTRRQQSGVALILTLAVLGVLALIVIGFLIAMRTEQTAARNYTHVIAARQFAQAAIDEAVFLIRTNTPVITTNRTYITQPGRIVSDSSPFQLLFSTNLPSAGTLNLNSDQSILAANTIYPNPDNRRIEVNWINIGTNGLAAGSGNPMLGRFAYWVDDEATKININTACTRTNILGAAMRDVDLTWISGIGGATATSSWNFANTNGYYSTEHWQSAALIGSDLYHSNKFYITAWGRDDNLTPWGAPRFDLNTTFSAFQTEIDGGAANTLDHPGLINWFGSTFRNKYGNDVHLMKQILANACDFRYSPAGAGNTCTGAQPGYLDANGIPRYYLGLKRQLHLNEIGVQAIYFRPAGGTEIQCKLFILVEVVNPYDQPWGNGQQIRVLLDKLRYRVSGDSGAWNYYCGRDTGWTAIPGCTGTYNNGPEVTYDITADVPANSYATYIIPVWHGNAEANATAIVDEVYVRINRVRLLHSPGANDTIRDWADLADFDLRDCSSGNHFCFQGAKIRFEAAGNFPGYDNDFTQGIAKNDPRVRRFSNWTPPGASTPGIAPWTPVGYNDANPTTLPNATGAQNSIVNFQSGTGLSGVPNDPNPSSTPTVANHPSFYMKTLTANAPFESPGELGYIHTGLQWRTLMLQPRPTPESSANHIPDWAVLDIFSITNGPVAGRININSVVTNLYTGNLNWRPRTNILTSLIMDNMHTHGFGPNTDRPRIATNIHDQVWAAGSTWGTARLNPPNNFMPGVYNFIGELCEIDRVATNYTGATNDAMREARIRSFANLVTVRSNVFQIWAVGQSIQDINNNGVFDEGTDLIVAESKAQAVVERYVEDGEVKFRTLYFRYLMD